MRGFWFGKKAVAKSRHRAVCDQRRRRVDNSVTNIPNRLTNNNYCKCCFRRVGFFSSCPECNFPDSFICLEWRISLVRIKWEFFLNKIGIVLFNFSGILFICHSRRKSEIPDFLNFLAIRLVCFVGTPCVRVFVYFIHYFIFFLHILSRNEWS